MRPKKNPKLLWIMGLLMVAAGVYLLFSVITPSSYKRAPGTVVSQSTDAGYQRQISFTAEDGVSYTGTDRSFTSDRRTAIPVTVAYDPDNPERTMRVVSDDSRTLLWGGLITLLGGVLVYLGFFPPHSRQYRQDASNSGANNDDTPDSGPQIDPKTGHVMRTKKHQKK
jgi:hypothetical protein